MTRASGVGSTASAGAAIERRAFFRACSLLALSVAGCSRVFRETRFARLALDEPHPDDYRPILRSLIRTILPFEHPRFPDLRPDALERRVLALFPLDRDARYLPLRRALALFNAIDLFPQLEPPVAAAERAALGMDRGAAPAAVRRAIAERSAHDSLLYAGFIRDVGGSDPRSFVELAPELQLRYFRLWGQSAFTAKRAFYQSAKGLVMVTAYSTKQLWSAIGYRGPLLEGES